MSEHGQRQTSVAAAQSVEASRKHKYTEVLFTERVNVFCVNGLNKQEDFPRTVALCTGSNTPENAAATHEQGSTYQQFCDPPTFLGREHIEP